MGMPSGYLLGKNEFAIRASYKLLFRKTEKNKY